MKNTILLLLLTLLLTACVERGYTLKPINTSMSKPIIDKPIHHTITKKPHKMHTLDKRKKHDFSKEKQEKPTIIHHQEIKKTSSTEKNSLFTLTDETKNNISGFFILIIGILILL